MAVPSAEAVGRAALARPTTTELVAAGGFVALVTSFVLDPHTIADGPVVCPFRRLTGLPCPGCGLTRAWVYAAHGWWRDSLTSNPFGVVSMLLVVVLAIAVVRARVLRRPPPDLDTVIRNRWAQALVAAWLTFAAVRIGVDLAA